MILSFLNNRHQRVVLNGQSLKWFEAGEAGVPQGSILGSLLFLVYIDDFPQGLCCNANIFAHDTSLSSTTTSPATSLSNLNEDSLKATQWYYQWKMSFNPDITKQAQEIMSFWKKNYTSHPSLYFNNVRIQRQFVKKHLALFSNENLSFLELIEAKIKKVTVGDNLMPKLNLFFTMFSLPAFFVLFCLIHLPYFNV